MCKSNIIDNIKEEDRICEGLCKDVCSYYTGEYGVRACRAGIVGTIRDDSTVCYKIQFAMKNINNTVKDGNKS